MTINRKLLAGVFISMSILINSCSVEDGEDGLIGPKGEQGEVGPQGEQGAQGRQGAQGQQGPQGEQGEAGEPGPQGEVGEQGPQGEQGEMGLQGEQGEPGQDGEDGNINVIASDWFNFESVYETFEPTGNSFFLTYNWSVPELTTNIADGGMVLVYAQINAYGMYGMETIPSMDNTVALPQSVLVLYDESDIIEERFEYSFTEGSIQISLYAHTFIMEGDMIDKGPSISKDEEYEMSLRYVLVPSGALAKNNIENLKKMSYQEVVSYLEIKS